MQALFAGEDIGLSSKCTLGPIKLQQHRQGWPRNRWRLSHPCRDIREGRLPSSRPPQGTSDSLRFLSQESGQRIAPIRAEPHGRASFDALTRFAIKLPCFLISQTSHSSFGWKSLRRTHFCDPSTASTTFFHRSWAHLWDSKIPRLTAEAHSSCTSETGTCHSRAVRPKVIPVALPVSNVATSPRSSPKSTVPPSCVQHISEYVLILDRVRML